MDDLKLLFRRDGTYSCQKDNSNNKNIPMNSLAIPVVMYSFWNCRLAKDKYKKMDCKTRKLLTMGKMHHPKGDVDRLYQKIERWTTLDVLIELESAYNLEIVR